MISTKQKRDLAKLIFHATWAVKGLEYSTRRASDWRSRDADRAAEYILMNYEVTKKTQLSNGNNDRG